MRDFGRFIKVVDSATNNDAYDFKFAWIGEYSNSGTTLYVVHGYSIVRNSFEDYECATVYDAIDKLRELTEG
jgi:hypothetical protein